MKIDLVFNVDSEGITFYNVSNLDSEKIAHAEKLATYMLKQVNKTYTGIQGSKKDQTITFLCELEEEEGDILIEL